MARAVAPHAIRVALRPVIRAELVKFALRLRDVDFTKLRMIHEMRYHNKVLARSAGLGLRVARTNLFMLRHVRLLREDLSTITAMKPFDFVHITTTFRCSRTAP